VVGIDIANEPILQASLQALRLAWASMSRVSV
jgi:hypothetical protein